MTNNIQPYLDKRIEEFENVWHMTQDVLNDNGAGSWGKWAMAQKELTAFLKESLESSYRQGAMDVIEKIPEENIFGKAPETASQSDNRITVSLRPLKSQLKAKFTKTN